MNKYQIELDYAKGIGIFLVVLGHTIYLQDNPSVFGQTMARWIYSFHMPLFFVISGVGIGLKEKLDVDVKKLALRYLRPYLFWSGIYILLNIILAPHMLKSILLARGYATITGRGMAPLWFLATLFLAEVIFYLSYSRFRSVLKIGGGILTGLCLVISECFFLFLREKEIINNLFLYPLISGARIFPALIFLTAGYYIGKKWQEFSRFRLVAALAAGAVFAVLQGWTENRVNMHTYSFNSLMVFVVTGVCGSLFLIALCCMLPKSLKILAGIGKSSMDIMIWHYPPIPTLKVLLMAAAVFKCNDWYLLIAFITLFGIYGMKCCVIEPVHRMIYKSSEKE